jgi:hypothetical protein
METGFQHPTPEQVERHMQEARRLRSETVHELLQSAGAALVQAVRVRMPESGGDVVGQPSRA